MNKLKATKPLNVPHMPRDIAEYAGIQGISAGQSYNLWAPHTSRGVVTISLHNNPTEFIAQLHFGCLLKSRDT